MPIFNATLELQKHRLSLLWDAMLIEGDDLSFNGSAGQASQP